jgi:hypothetical protein
MKKNAYEVENPIRGRSSTSPFPSTLPGRLHVVVPVPLHNAFGNRAGHAVTYLEHVLGSCGARAAAEVGRRCGQWETALPNELLRDLHKINRCVTVSLARVSRASIPACMDADGGGGEAAH